MSIPTYIPREGYARFDLQLLFSCRHHSTVVYATVEGEDMTGADVIAAVVNGDEEIEDADEAFFDVLAQLAENPKNAGSLGYILNKEEELEGIVLHLREPGGGTMSITEDHALYLSGIQVVAAENVDPPGEEDEDE